MRYYPSLCAFCNVRPVCGKKPFVLRAARSTCRSTESCVLLPVRDAAIHLEHSLPLATRGVAWRFTVRQAHRERQGELTTNRRGEHNANGETGSPRTAGGTRRERQGELTANGRGELIANGRGNSPRTAGGTRRERQGELTANGRGELIANGRGNSPRTAGGDYRERLLDTF